MQILKDIFRVAVREVGFLKNNHMYFFCMIVFPIMTTLFFTSMMNKGQPLEMPVGVVDMDNSATSRALIRRLDAFQTSKVISHYPNINEAREAIQRNEIYAFLFIPEHMADNLLSARQPKISFYYSMTTLAAGSLLFRDLKTVSTLGSAAVGQATMTAKGYTSQQIRTFLQPIAIDLHPLNNPMVNYSIYLTSMLIPGVLMLFMFLITAYSIGTELKFKRSKDWIATANGNIHVALIGKLLPQFLVFITIMYAYMYYVFGVLNFPHPGGVWTIMMLGLLAVLASQAFGVFAFGIMPSLRMSMSICSLWAVLSFTTAGAAFPLFAMDSPIRAIAQLFPLRHYYMIYQISVFNGYPLSYAWINVAAMTAFICLPVFVTGNIKKAMLEYVYIP